MQTYYAILGIIFSDNKSGEFPNDFFVCLFVNFELSNIKYKNLKYCHLFIYSCMNWCLVGLIGAPHQNQLQKIHKRFFACPCAVTKAFTLLVNGK